MSSFYRLTGIILNRKNLGSTDRKITFFSHDGKYELRARGAQKLESKLAGSLEPLTLVELTIVRGRTIDQITGSAIRDSFRAIHGSVPKIAAAGLVASAVDAFVHGRLDESIPFKRIREAFALISTSRTNRDLYLAVAYGLWNLSSLLGYAPQLSQLSVKPSVERLTRILIHENPNRVRRIRCFVQSARLSAEAAIAHSERVTDSSLPAGRFFHRAMRVVS